MGTRAKCLVVPGWAGALGRQGQLGDCPQLLAHSRFRSPCSQGGREKGPRFHLQPARTCPVADSHVTGLPWLSGAGLPGQWVARAEAAPPSTPPHRSSHGQCHYGPASQWSVVIIKVANRRKMCRVTGSLGPSAWPAAHTRDTSGSTESLLPLPLRSNRLASAHYLPTVGKG